MKSFLNFISEATASQQAARLGLVGDGHGGWYDKKTGEFTAKTEKGRLKFYNKRQKIGSQDPPQSVYVFAFMLVFVLLIVTMFQYPIF